MKIKDEGTSNAAHWHERAMKAEARLQKIMARCADLLDEDQFNELDAIVRAAVSTSGPKCERCSDTGWIQGDPVFGISDEPCGCAEARDTPPALTCEHPASLLLRSAETGEPLYCELCDDKSGRRDAEQCEVDIQARLAEAEALLRELQYRGSVIFETTAHHYWGPHPDRIAAHLTREGKP
jgi:hypothetical protein